MDPTQQPRRRFLQLSVTGMIAALFTKLPTVSFARSGAVMRKGVVVHEAEGEHILTGRRKAPITIKISKAKHGIDSVSFCTEDIIPARKLRVHKHLYADEFIFIHRGEGLFTLDDQLIEVKTGSVMFVPRGIWHGLENSGKENLLMTFGYSPAGFEGYFRENGTPVGMTAKERTAEEYALAQKKYGMVYK